MIFLVVGYIKEEKSSKKIFGCIEIRLHENNYIIAIKGKEKERTKKKLVKIIKRLDISALVFAKDLEGEFEEEIERRLSNEKSYSIISEKGGSIGRKENNLKIEIMTGKKLMEFMQFDILEHIIKKQGRNIKQEDVYIVFKKDSNLNLNYLKRFIENFRMTNIVTNEVERLKNVQDNLLENDNILISVSNNKRKALKRAKYIINVNLNKTELEKYRINRNAIIINVKENVKYSDPNFDGININDFEIELPDEYIERFEEIDESFEPKKMYECEIIQGKKENEEIHERIRRDEVKIKTLIGNNGSIEDKEFARISSYNSQLLQK